MIDVWRQRRLIGKEEMDEIFKIPLLAAQESSFWLTLLPSTVLLGSQVRYDITVFLVKLMVK